MAAADRAVAPRLEDDLAHGDGRIRNTPGPPPGMRRGDRRRARYPGGMSDASHPTNRLAAETSAYLRQHMRNPVDWHPWGEEALELARRLNKPILLSIGYSACHWCHVMAHESFEDPASAGSEARRAAASASRAVAQPGAGSSLPNAKRRTRSCERGE